MRPGLTRAGDWTGLVSGAALVASCAGAGPPASPVPAAPAAWRGTIYSDPPAMNRTVATRILPQVGGLIDRLLAERRAMRIDGVEVFNGKDKFLPGKIALGMSHVLLATPRTDPRFATYLQGFRDVADMTLGDPNETWGAYYYLLALYRLKQAGLLDEAVRPEALRALRGKLDWRHFVREKALTLVDLPNNYFGVAFSIARLRHLLGWENSSGSEALIARTLAHYRTYSGEYGFADETEGQGRFDRYSVLLIGEIAQRFLETGATAPPEIRRWLRRSVDLLLPRLNLRGEGFEYGRSLGPYGETALVEVLAAAAALGVLGDEEKAAAYAYSSRVSARHADFWIDPGTGSVNLWDHGRRTDAYRGKHRILGENLSLAHHHIYTSEIWRRLGYRDSVSDRALVALIRRAPAQSFTRFARGDYDRALFTYRHGGRLIGLPLINGAAGQHMNTPYFPIPFSPGLLQASPDSAYPQLIPSLVLRDGTRLQPLAFMKDIEHRADGRRATIAYRQDELDRMGGDAPLPDRRLTVETRYDFAPGRISRTDRFTAPDGPVDVAAVEMEFASFSSGPVIDGVRVAYREGDVRTFEAKGLDSCSVGDVRSDPRYHSPAGALRTRVQCRAAFSQPTRQFTIGWTLTYSE
jgi:hypothetical protein